MTRRAVSRASASECLNPRFRLPCARSDGDLLLPKPARSATLVTKPRGSGECRVTPARSSAITDQNRGTRTMSGYASDAAKLPWWKEPTKDQWYAYFAAWMGWTLDAFDFTVFLLIMAPIAQEFGVPIIEVTAVFSVTLVMRLGGATASGWLADRLGRRAPLMISILWYSICNLLAGLSPNFTFLFVMRALLGRGMGGECRAGGAFDMDSWPALSRGFMSGVRQGSWGL